jgi:hypothetical protein
VRDILASTTLAAQHRWPLANYQALKTLGLDTWGIPKLMDKNTGVRLCHGLSVFGKVRRD